MTCKIDPTFSFRTVNEASRVQDFGEVFTPLRFVSDMLNLLDADTWTNPATVLVEPTCGDGAFVVEMLRRRFLGLGKTRNRQTAVAIAVTTMWAIDIQRDNVRECRANVLRVVLNHLYPDGVTIENVKADLVYLAAIVAAIEHHIKPGDGLAFTAKEPSFLALSATKQQKVAQDKLGLLRTILGGRMVGSWLTEVFHPAEQSLFPYLPETEPKRCRAVSRRLAA